MTLLNNAYYTHQQPDGRCSWLVTPQHWCWCPLCSIIPSFATNIWLGGKFNVPWGAVSVMFSCCRPPPDLYSDIYNSSRTSCSCHKMIGMRSSSPTYKIHLNVNFSKKRMWGETWWANYSEMVVYWAGVRVMTVCARIKRAGYSLWVAAALLLGGTWDKCIIQILYIADLGQKPKLLRH